MEGREDGWGMKERWKGMERRTWDGERGEKKRRRGRRRGRNEKNQYKEGRTGGGGDKEFK